MFVLCAIIALSFLFYKWVWSHYDFFEKKGVAFNKPMFLFGSNSNLLINRMSLPEITEKWYNELRNEKISGLFEFFKPLYFVRCPKLAKKLAVREFEYFPQHRVLVDESMDKMFGKALLSLTGQKWKDMRSTLSPMFTGSKMRMMYDYVASVGQQSAETIKEQIKNGGDNVFEFKALASKFTIDVIASCAFGIEINSFKNPENDFQKIAVHITDFGNIWTSLKFFGYMLLPPIMRAFKISLFSKDVERFFQESVKDNMKYREDNGVVRNDMINLLIEAKKKKLSHETKAEEKIKDGFATVEESQLGKSQVTRIWEDDDLAAQCFLFFLGGFDTIATTLGFIPYELACNPDIQEKLFNEIRTANEELDGEMMNYDKIQSLKYMDQVVCETLRKWPPAVMTDRVCVKDYDVEVDDRKFVINKGTFFLIPIYAIHRDPTYYPDPLKFDPERFNDENRVKIDPDTFIPFGLGPRNCIGSRFALMELKTIIYFLLLNFSFEVTEKTQIPLKLSKNPIGLKTEKGIWIALKPRE